MERSTQCRVRICLLVQQKKPWQEILGHLSLKPQNRGRLDHVYCKTELFGGSWRQITSYRALENHLFYF